MVFAPRTRGVKDFFSNHGWALFLLIASEHQVTLTIFGWSLSSLHPTIWNASDDQLQSIIKTEPLRQPRAVLRQIPSSSPQ
jgi:hypothetical protein